MVEIEAKEEQGKHLENFSLKEKRDSLFSHLDYAIGLSREKAAKEKTATEDRQRWLRIMISAVEAYSKLLSERELEDLEERVANMERRNEVFE